MEEQRNQLQLQDSSLPFPWARLPLLTTSTPLCRQVDPVDGDAESLSSALPVCQSQGYPLLSSSSVTGFTVSCLTPHTHSPLSESYQPPSLENTDPGANDLYTVTM